MFMLSSFWKETLYFLGASDMRWIEPILSKTLKWIDFSPLRIFLAQQFSLIYDCSVKIIMFVDLFTKSLKNFLENPKSNEAELVTITLGFLPSISSFKSCKLLIALICLKANGLSSISWNPPLKFNQLRWDFATSRVSLLMCSKYMTGFSSWLSVMSGL